MSDEDILHLECAKLLHDLGDLRFLLRAFLDQQLKPKRLHDLKRQLAEVSAQMERASRLLPALALAILLLSGCAANLSERPKQVQMSLQPAGRCR